MIDEGYIKFDCDWTEDADIPGGEIADLIDWRNRLYAAGLIGYYADSEIGFGNISRREPGANEFVISATQTGDIAPATGRHFTRVVDVDIAGNRVVCRGPLRASSESLTHAAIYALDPDFLAVVHVHSSVLWQSLSGAIPTTDAGVAYGTPEMAHEFRRLYRDDGLRETRMAVMAGHEEGLISVGGSVGEAAERLLAAKRSASA